MKFKNENKKLLMDVKESLYFFPTFCLRIYTITLLSREVRQSV